MASRAKMSDQNLDLSKFIFTHSFFECVVSFPSLQIRGFACGN